MGWFTTGCRGGSRRLGGWGEPVHRYDEHVNCVVSTKVGKLECVPWCYVWKMWRQLSREGMRWEGEEKAHR